VLEPSLIFRIPRERGKYTPHSTHHTQDVVFL
jgi:transposase